MARRIGESLREGGLLIGVFGFLEPVHTGTLSLRWTVGVVGVTLALMFVGLWLEDLGEPR